MLFIQKVIVLGGAQSGQRRGGNVPDDAGCVPIAAGGGAHNREVRVA